MIKGLLIGIGMILPGVSGGVIAVILGIYDKIIRSLNNFRKNAKESIKFLLPLFIGIIVGSIIGANLLSYIFTEYYVESCYLFIGLIIGSVPYLIKECNKKCKKGINYGVLIVTLFISVIVSIICKNNFDFSSSLDNSFSSIIKLFLTGFLFVSGKVVPGISSSFMLMMIGMYSYFLEIMSNPLSVIMNEFYNMIPILIGVVSGAVILVKLMGMLLDKYYSITYSVIIGFVLGSLVMIYPNEISLISIILLIIGFVVSYYFSIAQKK